MQSDQSTFQAALLSDAAIDVVAKLRIYSAFGEPMQPTRKEIAEEFVRYHREEGRPELVTAIHDEIARVATRGGIALQMAESIASRLVDHRGSDG